jgi:hypothetical protein
MPGGVVGVARLVRRELFFGFVETGVTAAASAPRKPGAIGGAYKTGAKPLTDCTGRVARKAALVGESAVAKGVKRGGACPPSAHGVSSSDANRATHRVGAGVRGRRLVPFQPLGQLSAPGYRGDSLVNPLRLQCDVLERHGPPPENRD